MAKKPKKKTIYRSRGLEGLSLKTVRSGIPTRAKRSAFGLGNLNQKNSK
jgi:hypothetical protein